MNLTSKGLREICAVILETQSDLPVRGNVGRRGGLWWGTVGLWPSGEKCVDTVFQLMNSVDCSKKRKKEKSTEEQAHHTVSGYMSSKLAAAHIDEAKCNKRSSGVHDKRQKNESNSTGVWGENNETNKRKRTRHKIVCKITELYRIGPSCPGRVE